MNHDSTEETPLIEPTEQTAEPEPIKSKVVKAVAIAGILSLLFGFLYIGIYWIYIPNEINHSMKSTQPVINRVEILTLEPVKIKLDLKIPMSPPKPLDVSVDIKEMTLYTPTNSSFQDRIPLLKYDFGKVYIKRGLGAVDMVKIITISNLNLAEIYWLVHKMGMNGIERRVFEA